MRGYKKGLKENVLREHDREHHGGGGQTRFKMKVRRVFGRDNRRRMIDEAVRIENNKGIMMNRKGEFRSSVLPMLVVHRGAEGQQGRRT